LDNVELGLTKKAREVQGSCAPTGCTSKQTAISSCLSQGIYGTARILEKNAQKSVEGSQ
jgi:hypothetical protein